MTAIEQDIKGVMIVEDDLDIADALKDHIQGILDKIKEWDRKPQIIQATNYNEWKEVESIEQFLHIIDLHLGKSEDEGIAILSELYKKDQSIPSIIYTAHDAPKQKTICINLGVDEEDFFPKRSLENDLSQIGSRVKKRFYVHAQTRDKLVDVNPIKIPVPNPPVILENSVTSHFYNNIIGDYQSLPFTHKMALCKFVLPKREKGYFYFALNNYLLEGTTLEHNAIIGDADQSKVSFKIRRFFNRHNHKLEKIIIIDNDANEEEVGLASWNEVETYLKSEQAPAPEKEGLVNDLKEVFIAQRLKELYLTSSNENRAKIIKIGLQLEEKKGTIELLTLIWEWVTEMQAEDIEETNELLGSFYDEGYPQIEDVFYCQVDEIHKEEEMIHATVVSVEDLDKPFMRAFDLNVLAKHGVSNPKSTFKIIVYDYGEKSERRPGLSHYIEPIPLRDFYRKTNQ